MKNSKWFFLLFLGICALASCEDDIVFNDEEVDPIYEDSTDIVTNPPIDSTDIIIDPPVDSTIIIDPPTDPEYPIDSSDIDIPTEPIDSSGVNIPGEPADSTGIGG